MMTRTDLELNMTQNVEVIYINSKKSRLWSFFFNKKQIFIPSPAFNSY